MINLFKRKEPYTGPRFRAVRRPEKNKYGKHWWRIEEYKEGRWVYQNADYFSDDEADQYVKELENPRIVYGCSCNR